MISIIVVSYNSEKYITGCLDSVFAQAPLEFEVIVVDNCSQDNTRLFVSRNPQIILVENSRNLGVCKARNQAIERAKGEFIFCLDPDARLKQGALSGLLSVMKHDEAVGAAGPKVLLDDSKVIYSAGIYPTFLWRFHDIGSGKPDGPDFNRQGTVFGISAAAALYRKKALDTVKNRGEYFDEDLFYFFEDADISWRLRKKGWKIIYAPAAECLHRAGRSRNKDRVSQYFSMRNRCLIILKNESFPGLLRAPVVFLFYDLWRDIFMLLANPVYFFKAIFETVKLYPKMLNKRWA